MTSRPSLINQWEMARPNQWVRQDEFSNALAALREDIEAFTGQKTSLALEYSSADDRIVATIRTAESDLYLPVTAVMETGWPKPHAIQARIDPVGCADPIARAFLCRDAFSTWRRTPSFSLI